MVVGGRVVWVGGRGARSGSFTELYGGLKRSSVHRILGCFYYQERIDIDACRIILSISSQRKYISQVHLNTPKFIGPNSSMPSPVSYSGRPMQSA